MVPGALVPSVPRLPSQPYGTLRAAHLLVTCMQGMTNPDKAQIKHWLRYVEIDFEKKSAKKACQGSRHVPPTNQNLKLAR